MGAAVGAAVAEDASRSAGDVGGAPPFCWAAVAEDASRSAGNVGGAPPFCCARPTSCPFS